jgi:hypothetical protein
MSAVTERDGHDDDNESIGVLEAPEAFSGSADEFVREYLTMTCRREVSPSGGFRWGPCLDALWRTWEHFRGDGATGTCVWWRDHAAHMIVLLSPVGPFAEPSWTVDTGEPLPYTAPPPGLFVDVRTIGS